MYVCVYVYMYEHMYVCVYKYVCMCVFMYMCACINVCIYAYMCMNSYTYFQAYEIMHKLYIWMYVHNYTCTPNYILHDYWDFIKYLPYGKP